jgi:hypothetical protein
MYIYIYIPIGIGSDSSDLESTGTGGSLAIGIGNKQSQLFTRLSSIQQQLLQTKLLILDDSSLTSRNQATSGMELRD